jgi:hypothetical protein
MIPIHALWTRGIGLKEDPLDQGRRHAPRLVHVVDREQGAIGDPIAPSEDQRARLLAAESTLRIHS